MKKISILLALFWAGISLPSVQAQVSTLTIRNNTWLELDVQVEQTGSHMLDPSEWNQLETEVHPWRFGIELMETDRDAAAIPMGDSVFFDVHLIAQGDTLDLRLRLTWQCLLGTVRHLLEFLCILTILKLSVWSSVAQTQVVIPIWHLARC